MFGALFDLRYGYLWSGLGSYFCTRRQTRVPVPVSKTRVLGVSGYWYGYLGAKFGARILECFAKPVRVPRRLVFVFFGVAIRLWPGGAEARSSLRAALGKGRLCGPGDQTKSPRSAPQVVADFVSEMDLMAAESGAAGVDESKRLQAQRQLNFLKRKGSPTATEIRPRKRFRRRAFQWVVGVDNQLVRSTGQGLLAYAAPASEESNSGPEGWRRLSIAPDQGGDGLSGFSYMARHLNLVVDLTPDPSHGINNDVWGLFSELGLKGLFLLWLVVFNIPVGPWATDARYHECRNALDELFREHSYDSCPLLQSMAPKILQDPAYRDLQDGGGDVMQGLWSRLASDSPWRVKGTKLVKSRFMGFCRTARAEMNQATARGFGYLYRCMEMGFLGEKNIKTLRFAAGDGTEDVSGPKSSTRESKEEAQLRLSCMSNMVLGCMQFKNSESCSNLRLLLELLRPLEAWHTDQNHTLRSDEASAPWIIRQLKGSFMDTLFQVRKTLSSQSSLGAVPLTLPVSGRVAKDPDAAAGQSFVEDTYATTMGGGALVAVSLRLHRCLWMLRGWPSRSVLFLADGDIPKLALQVLVGSGA